ncbi:mechanosensitive ion channel family protein [Salinisphaera shabanensis T35B1]|uniref:mechanosensitive ion channel family protein n=1 Tax=Salinisphaera shabanensis TaxID=180542 RepID=UPI00334025A9
MLESLDTPVGRWALTLVTGAATATAVTLAYVLLIKLGYRLIQRRAIAREFLQQCDVSGGVVVFLLTLQVVWTASDNDVPWIDAIRHINSLCLILALTWAALKAITAIGDVIVSLNPAIEGRHHAARKVETQARFLTRGLTVLVAIIGISTALMTFPSIRQLGTSLLASAGIGGLIIGFAARPVLSNLLAGLQIALSQPFRIEDVLKFKDEWCWVEEVTTTYVVLRTWDLRRLVVPLQWFIENPFENWTRRPTSLMGTVFMWLDYRMPVPPLRAEFERLLKADGAWDELIGTTQVVESGEHAMQIRFLMSSTDSIALWHLRCRMREALLDFVQREYPDYLPNVRARINENEVPEPARPPAAAGHP